MGLLFAVGLLLAVPASAHLVFPSLKGERWIIVRLDQDPIRIQYRIGRGMELARPVRRAADTNGDFEVSATEGNAALDARSKQLLARLEVCTGRTLQKVQCTHLASRDIERVEADGWTPGVTGHLVFTWTLRLHQRADQIGALRLEDSYPAEGVEITEVRIHAPRGKHLRVAGDGRATGVRAQFGWTEQNRPPGPRVVVAEWPPPRRARGLFALGIAVGLVLVLWVVWSRLRRPRSAAPG